MRDSDTERYLVEKKKKKSLNSHRDEGPQAAAAH